MVSLVLAIAVIAFIVFIERSLRKILVQYPKRQQGGRMMGGQAQHLPLKLNVAGVIPPILPLRCYSCLYLLNLSGSQGNGPDWLLTLNSLLGRGQPLVSCNLCFDDCIFCIFLYCHCF